LSGKDACLQQNLIANVSVTIDAPPDVIWQALTDPDAIERYMFGARVDSNWQVGHPIVWRGYWKGKPYRDKGTIRQVERPRTLSYTHFSPRSGLSDVPENYHQITINLEPEGACTRVSLTQDKNTSEEARVHSARNWRAMLAALKKHVEGR
jgi:uncharacterized protein YndB with AHSA1/START domain